MDVWLWAKAIQYVTVKDSFITAALKIGTSMDLSTVNGGTIAILNVQKYAIIMFHKSTIAISSSNASI